MKKKIFVSVMVLMCLVSFSQGTTENIINKMNTLLAGAKKAPALVVYSHTGKSLLVNDFVIPVTDNLILRKEKRREGSAAVFYYQKGEAVRKKSDSTWRRAYYELAFPTRNGAAGFVQLFKELNTLINK